MRTVRHRFLGCWHWIVSLIEVGIACLCSLVTWRYISHHNQPLGCVQVSVKAFYNEHAWNR